jgi:ribonucleoside-diphosphate reductase alpha chain
MVKNGKVDWERLKQVAQTAVRFLDDVIDVNNYPLPDIASMTQANRKIGLGIMGWADMLMQLEIPYESNQACELGERVMKFIQTEGRKASEALAREKEPFPNFKKSVFKKGKPVRNATVTTIAPTGTISMIADCSSGIEPIYSISYVKTVMDGKKLEYLHPLFEKVCKERGIHSDELKSAVAQGGSLKDIAGVPPDVRQLFKTAHEIAPEWHVRMQAAFQKYTDNAVSKTVNLRNDATVEDIANVYLLSYDLGCKGVTVFRDGCRGTQVLDAGTADKGVKQAGAKQTRLTELDVDENGMLRPRSRPAVTQGATVRMETGCGYLYVTINEDENGRLFEVFARMGKAGGCTASQTEAIGRLVSLALRSNIDPASVIKQLKSIRCPEPTIGKDKIFSCPDAIGKALEKYLELRGKAPAHVPKPEKVKAECKKCGGGPVVFMEGCYICLSCGDSKCG